MAFLIAAAVGLLAAPPTPAGEAEANFGVIESRRPMLGYTLFAPYRGTSAYLIDNEGRLINQWEDPDGLSAGASMYLTERGTLVRALLKGGPPWGAGGGIGGLIREYDWDGNVIWDFHFQSDEYQAHHDIELMPNGNVLITAYEKDDVHSGNWDHIVEVKPDYVAGVGGTVEWVWRLKDHLGANDPKRWDPARPANINSIDYNPELDQILLGCNSCSELFIIDHDTTTEEAAGPKGDFLYRWGNPQNYAAGGPEDQKLNFQHTVRWIKNEFGYWLGSKRSRLGRWWARKNHLGNIIAFNNRYPSMGSSSVIEIEPPLKRNGTYDGYGPDDFAVFMTEVTDATGSHTFASPFLSSAQKLPGGRYLIDVGAVGGFTGSYTNLYEVKADGKTVWKYVPPVFSFNPGQSPASDWLPYGKCPDGYVAADATELPTATQPGLATPTQWFFRATRYSPLFRGFWGKDMRPGPYLSDLAGTTQPDCNHHYTATP